MQSQVNEIDGGGEKAYEVTEVRQTMVAVEAGSVLLVFGVLLTQFGISFLIGAHSHLTSQTMFLLDLLHDQHALCGRRTEPLRVQTGHDHGHKEQTHLLRLESVREAWYYSGGKKQMHKVLMGHLYALMPVQQFSRVIHGIYGQIDCISTQQTIEIKWEQFALHKTERVHGHLGDQHKTWGWKKKELG